MQSISPRQDRFCAICGTYESVMPNPEEHHLVPRSLGGMGTELICVRCHNNTEGSTAWKVGHTDDYLFVLDNKGKMIVQRWHPPARFDEGEVISILERFPPVLQQMAFMFKYCSDEGLVKIAASVGEIMKHNWYAVGTILGVMRLRMPYGDRAARFTAMAQQFDLERSQGYRLAAIAQSYDEHYELFRLSEKLPPPEVVQVVAKHPEPEAAFNLWLDQPESITAWKAQLRTGQFDSVKAEWCNCATACGYVRAHPKQKATQADYDPHTLAQEALRQIDEGQAKAGTPF